MWVRRDVSMSRIAFEMRDQMDDMSEADFEDTMGLSKSEFRDYLRSAADQEDKCLAQEGEPAPNFAAHTLNAEGSISSGLLDLSDLRGAPVSLIFGCYTCPVFRRQSDRMKQLIEHYGGRVQFVFVYVLEAHPTDGWNTDSNRATGVMYAQTINLEDRAKVANDWRSAYEFENPVVLDWPDNRINADYAGEPERLYVLDGDGIVTFKSEQGPYYDSHLEDWAAALENVVRSN
ncbi:deiodinase-like protein [Sulfitobacter sp. SK011]|uniref:deiodinase-like protein n=1 Tax=Sulfitobacter sp. SK011 TaxID=1389004 RepID=UPI00267214B3|nr:deiodinase-like protein [Sulfitobacter sp. SK011]